MKLATLEAIRAARAEKRSVALVTGLSSGTEALVTDDTVEGAPLAPSLVAAARESLRQDRSGTVEDGGERWFVHAYNPPLRLVIVGAVHIAQPLARMAMLAGWDVTLVDPRGAFATADRFPGLTLMEDWPDDAMRRLAPDTRTAVVTLTHDPKLDDPALEVALRSPAFYIGALGSRRTHAKRIDRLKERGFTESEMARIHAPIGLDLGGRAPAEIAVAIVAELTLELHRQPDEAVAA